ncbi:class I SAM-dependent methyltransferase [Candidatus Pacearchaeota archaeon CG10_big_fil_rev_8_21_14_0_10_31_24]|nr:MAG: class I SAM-dependent methyltransferase [Candidatus Pacearchaeota archaeon CG10_big_fil_rev_8_21_14_0_10_31_24]
MDLLVEYMKLNKIEFLLMNNPIRNIIQKHIEVKRLRNWSNLPPNKTVLEIGCGTGNGSRLIKKHFQAKRIYATDLDKRMIDIAKKNNKDGSITFEVQDATKLKYKNNYFDAVFDLGVIHHIPNWKDCLKELKRVLKPKGQLIIEDLSIETFSTSFGKLMKKSLDHPYNSMQKEDEFVDYLKKMGFGILAHKKYSTLIRYFIVVAQK